MKLTKEDINKIANEMSECTFDENGFIVEDNKKESETMKNQKTDKIVMNKATWTIFYSLIRDKVNEARVTVEGITELPPVSAFSSKKEIKDAGRHAAKLYKEYYYPADETHKSIPELKRDSIRIAQTTGDYIKPKFESEEDEEEMNEALRTRETEGENPREVYYFIDNILFPRLNKQDKLEKYVDQIPHSCSTYRVLVRREVELSKGDWDKAINCNLLSDRVDLYKETGGFFDKNTRTVTKVRNAATGECVFIDTQGYRYARYVGMKNGNLEEPLKVTPGEEVTDDTYDAMEGCINFTDLESLEGSVKCIYQTLTSKGYNNEDIVNYIKTEVEKVFVRSI